MKLGSRVKDQVTGFQGIAVARCEYLNGCIQFEVKSENLHEGQPISGQWIDADQLTLMHISPLTVLERAEPPGGPQDTPPGASHPA